LVFALLGTLSLAQHAAAAAIWQDRVPQANIDTRALNAPAHGYRALALDLAALRTQLDMAPDEHSAATPLHVPLPMPDGGEQQFEVWRTQVMAPALAARYPQIRSFRAVAIGHPEISARLDDSPHGFSAMIRNRGDVVVLQPVQRGDPSHYISFRRDALGAAAAGFKCLLDGTTAQAM